MLVGTEPPEGPAPAPWGPQAGRRHLSPWQAVSSSWRNFILMFAVKTLENAQSRGLLRDQRARPEDDREARTFPAQPQRQPTPGRLLKSPTRCRGEARRAVHEEGAPGAGEPRATARRGHGGETLRWPHGWGRVLAPAPGSVHQTGSCHVSQAWLPHRRAEDIRPSSRVQTELSPSSAPATPRGPPSSALAAPEGPADDLGPSAGTPHSVFCVFFLVLLCLSHDDTDGR